MKTVFEQSIKQVVSAVATLLVAGSVFAQSYPSKPVTLLVPYPAGGVSDVIARTLNTVLAKHLGQPVLVENLGGASGDGGVRPLRTALAGRRSGARGVAPVLQRRPPPARPGPRAAGTLEGLAHQA